jgi:hypothetical protein
MKSQNVLDGCVDVHGLFPFKRERWQLDGKAGRRCNLGTDQGSRRSDQPSEHLGLQFGLSTQVCADLSLPPSTMPVRYPLPKPTIKPQTSATKTECFRCSKYRKGKKKKKNGDESVT